jgi:hypothetical protein
VVKFSEMNRNQKILTFIALIAMLLVAADYQSARIWRFIGWEEIDKSPPSLGWHTVEWVVIGICYVGLSYLLRSKSQWDNG